MPKDQRSNRIETTAIKNIKTVGLEKHLIAGTELLPIFGVLKRRIGIPNKDLPHFIVMKKSLSLEEGFLKNS
jgi:hypothetical protein